MARLYLDTGVLVWNGNVSLGKDNVQTYFQNLPSSHHTIVTLDSHPIVDDSISNQPTLLVHVSGNVTFQNNPIKPFQQSFMITAQDDKWKIVSDCFRLQDGLSTMEKKVSFTS